MADVSPDVPVEVVAEPTPAEVVAVNDPAVDVAVVIAEPAVSLGSDPTYQCDHPVLGRAGTLRIWRFPNNHGVAVTRNFTNGVLSVVPIKFTGIEVTSYDVVGDETRLSREEDIPAHTDAAKAL